MKTLVKFVGVILVGTVVAATPLVTNADDFDPSASTSYYSLTDRIGTQGIQGMCLTIYDQATNKYYSAGPGCVDDVMGGCTLSNVNVPNIELTTWFATIQLAAARGKHVQLNSMPLGGGNTPCGTSTATYILWSVMPRP